MHKTLVVVAGATATGKTGIAIDLAMHFDTEIVSADSRQVFMEMRIGTAAPTQDEMLRVKHHLVRHRSIHDDYNAGIYELEALRAIDSIFEHNDVAILVGGSGLYIDAVCKGFDTLPGANQDIRKELERGYAESGIQWLQEQVKKLDPDYFHRADIMNPRRLMRALEVMKLTGRPYSTQITLQGKKRGFDILKYCLRVPRPEIHQRIAQRVDKMMLDGLLEEVETLYPFRQNSALLTVGYQELFDYLEGKISLRQAIEKIKTNTRRYARRQETWFRRDTAYQWVEAKDLVKAVQADLQALNQ